MNQPKIYILLSHVQAQKFFCLNKVIGLKEKFHR